MKKDRIFHSHNLPGAPGTLAISKLGPAAKRSIFTEGSGNFFIDGIVAMITIGLAIPVSLFLLVLMMAWPLLGWVVRLDLGFQFFRMLYYWDTPSVHATLTFLLHFGVVFAVMLSFVLYNPKK